MVDLALLVERQKNHGLNGSSVLWGATRSSPLWRPGVIVYFKMKNRMEELRFDPVGTLRGLGVISGKWKVLIICHLLGGTKRFNELHRLLAGISRGTLTFELRQLQKDGIIDRTQYSTIPPTVEYKVTTGGHELKPILVALDEWSKRFPARNKNSS